MCRTQTPVKPSTRSHFRHSAQVDFARSLNSVRSNAEANRHTPQSPPDSPPAYIVRLPTVLVRMTIAGLQPVINES